MKIDRKSAVPIYKQIRTVLRKKLGARKLRPDQPFFSEIELMEKFGVQRATIRQATAQLVAEGLVYKIKGKGMFVKSAPGGQRKVIDVPFSESWIDRAFDRVNWFVDRDILRGISIGMEAHDMYLRLHNVNSGADYTNQFSGRFDPGSSAGVIFFGLPGNERIVERLRTMKIPYVVAGATKNDLTINAVFSDREEACCSAVRYLIENGHARIALLNGPLTSVFFQERYNGYHKAHVLHGLVPDPALMIECGGAPEDGCKAMNELLKRAPGFTAVFAATDLRAIGAMRALREQGLKIPGDVSIVGFDDIDEAQEQDPPLTTLGKERVEVGRQAVELLMDLNKGVVTEPARRIVPMQLIVRSSVTARKIEK